MLSFARCTKDSHPEDKFGFFEDPNPLIFRRKGSGTEGLLLTSPDTNMASRNGIINTNEAEEATARFSSAPNRFPPPSC